MPPKLPSGKPQITTSKKKSKLLIVGILIKLEENLSIF
jgi:hypothetical protein